MLNQDDAAAVAIYLELNEDQRAFVGGLMAFLHSPSLSWDHAKNTYGIQNYLNLMTQQFVKQIEDACKRGEIVL